MPGRKRANMSDRLVLALDGSTRVCSAALLRVAAESTGLRWEVLARRAEAGGQAQARMLLSLVDQVLEEVGAQPADMGTIVVGTGPGTFTGVRIAVATARGLAIGLTLPVLGASTLSALAAGAVAQATEQQRAAWTGVVPVIDARRHQLFFSVYEASGLRGRYDGPRWTRRRPIEVCDQGSLESALGQQCLAQTVVVGDDAELVGELPAGVEFVNASVQAEHLVTGQEWLVEGSEGKGPETKNEVVGSAVMGSPETVKPIYVRAPDADMHITKMKDPWADGRDRR
jgi:tRNA threonylcarbamoyladenosine biosynthesis protein TsaB